MSAPSRRYGVWVTIRNPRPATKMLAAEADGWAYAPPSLEPHRDPDTGYVVSTSKETLEELLRATPAKDARISYEIRVYEVEAKR